MKFRELLILGMCFSFSFCENENAKTVLENVLNNTKNINQSYSVELNQTQKKKLNKFRIFDVFVHWVDSGNVQKKTRIILNEPKNMKGVSYWVHLLKNTEKKRWMTMPITGKLVDISNKPVNRNEFDISELELSLDVINNHENSIIGNEIIFDRNCTIIKSSPKSKSIRNPIKKLWIDEENKIIRKAEFISKTGRTLKEINITKIVQIDSLQFPEQIEVFDKKKKIHINLRITDMKLKTQENILIFEPKELKYD